MDSLVSVTPLSLLQRILLAYIAASTYQFYLASPSSTSNSTSAAGDATALLAFKSLLFDPHYTLSSWNVNNTSNVCNWHGIGCQSEGRRRVVTAVRLESLGLTGMISPAIADLTFLRVLHLPNNQLNGSIPRELGDLHHLRYLNLRSNALEGAIPDTLSQCSRLHTISIGSNKLRGSLPSSMARCSRLRIIDFSNNLLTGEIPDEYRSRLPELLGLFLSSNNLSGAIPAFGSNGSSSLVTSIFLSNNSLTEQIPESLGNLTSLTLLYLSRNHLVGHIPPSLGNCMNLTHVYVRDNNLEGNIPDSLGQLTRLRNLDVSNNYLSGVIPLSLYNLASLTILNLAMNRLVETIPPDIFQALPELQFLSLSCNNLQGPIPQSFSNATQLQHLDLSDNSFSGVIPSNLGHLNNLVMLGLEINRFEAKEAKDWDFFSSLANCTNLKKLFLSHNYLAGNFPASIGNLSTRLERLFMSELQISGAIPPEIGKLQGLQSLDLSENFITGSIPSTIASLPNLTQLYLFRNRLSGHIPESLGNLNRLEVLQLGDNDLHGNIPSSFSAFRQLNELNVSFNRLNGTIPNELVKISSLTKVLDLSHNYFTGPIPRDVNQLNLLVLLDISENKLSGELPVTLGGCETLNSLYMEGNSFQGAIPSQLRNLSSLQRLDISRNKFSGQIPEFFAELESLQYLNISFNDFEGPVPIKGVFANTSEIFMNGNSRLCGGAPALQLPSCLVHSSKDGNFFNTPRIVVLTILSSSLCFILLAAIIILRKKVSSQRLPRLSSSRDKFKMVSYLELHKATDGFSSVNLIGTGNFSSVYKGNLDGYQNPVAVKVLNLAERGALKSYMAECEALKSIRHRNLVKILTCCSSIDHRGNDFKALVLEFVPNCSLEDWLHPKHPSKYLCLDQRLKIAIDIASALEYLHHQHGQTPIAHCDVKPSNILLDYDMHSKLGDFGLTKFIHGASSATTGDPSYSIAVKGSIGYIPPEYGMGGKVSTHGDVYSYGILLLEMVTGKRPTDNMFYDGRSLRSFVEEFFQNVDEIVDPVILLSMGDDSQKDKIEVCLASIVEIGLSCSREAPDARMDMKTVTTKLAAIESAYLGCDKTSQ
ncbi:putative receptor-like protein kinase At3g47110 [Zingiber officinale]|nr:putative receptor-like protein kinase At3g47110 [Zingiber officinale]